MNKIFITPIFSIAMLSLPALAAAQHGNGQVQGFGGVTMSGATTAPTFGGSVAVPIGDSIQIFGEGGKLSNLTSTPIAALAELSPVNVSVSAYYGQAGVRILTGSERGVRPYGEVSAGMARLHTGVSGLGATGGLIDTALGFTDRTEPILGVGAGLMLQSGPMVIDLGYRYKHISGGDAVQQLLTGGDLGISQFRLGVGVRF